MNDKFEIRAMSAPWHRGINILIRNSDFVAVSLQLEKHDPNMVIEPTVSIGIDEAQTLMDDLWAAGIRPTEGSGSAGSLRATEKHLQDMRAITFYHIGVTPPVVK
jgi:hypothetical protein